MSAILVTGGAGFIGSHLVDVLLARGDRVVCIDNFNDYYDPAIKHHNVAPHSGNANYTLIEDDIRDAALVNRLFEEHGITRVAHLAAMAGVRYSTTRAPLYTEVNLNGTINLLEAARLNDIQNFVLASTSSIYGETDQIPFREEQPADLPLAPYPATKKAAEVMAYAYHNLFALNITAVRFFTVYGPRVRPDMMAYMVIERLLKGEKITLFNNGEMHRDWTYVDDIIAGVVAALDKPLGYEIVNLGRGEPVRLGDFVDILSELTGKQPLIEAIDAPPTEPLITYADVSKAGRLFGYQPKTSIADGLVHTWKWYQTIHSLTPED